ncbi:MAG: ABC transporter ATP-binding protein [Oscillospiraceae bacterium]|nr:ABC transporter ATP-binding protein [Oscillospiraceae bacterium]
MREVILKAEKLEKAFGGLKILHGVDFDLKEGERLALIGPNGAGKSTLLNTIGGQGPATAGKITFYGNDITNLSPNKRLHLGLGRSFQVNNLFWQPSVLMNVMMALYGGETSHLHMFRRLEKRADLVDEAERLLDIAGLLQYKDEPPTLLSYGEQRMLEMVMGFAAKPKLVLLDEPSAGLPTAEVDSFIKILRRLAGNTALLFCAHDMDLVFALADEIMVLYYGTIISKGPPSEIAADSKVQEVYLGGEDDTYDKAHS